jgi:hypothetical protein
MKKVYTFYDLQFGPHSVVGSGVRATLNLPNNITVSVVGGNGLYGDGVRTFEVAAWRTDSNEWIKLSDHDDVRGYVSKDEVTELIQTLSSK